MPLLLDCKTNVPHLQVEGTTMKKRKASIKDKKFNTQSGHDWVQTTKEWRREQFVLICEKRVCQQRSDRCGYLENSECFCDLAWDRCVQKDEASFDYPNASALHIRDMVDKLLKRLLNSFVAQTLIELIKALMEW